jgi:hypothetical protein
MSKYGKPKQSPSLLPPHESIITNIIEGMHKPEPMKPRASAAEPCPDGPGFVSLGKGQERSYDPLPEGYIPLFPTRLSIKDFALNNLHVSNEGWDYVAPVEYTILNLDYHDLVSIRKGYVYMYDPEIKVWDVYRYQTEAGDENSVVGDPNTQEVIPAPNYSFTRYNVKNGQENLWQVDVLSCSAKQGSFPYLLLREDATEVYVAYSEFRWPKTLFKEIEKSNAFLDQFMTPVYRSQAKPYQRVDKLANLPSFSSFFESDQVKEEANEALVEENVIRYTARYIKSIKDIARSDLALERALFIALDDDVGNLLDVNMSVQNAYEYSLRYEEENAYALTTGRIVKQLKDKGIVSEDQWYESEKDVEDGFFAELDDDFETGFKDVNDVSKELKKNNRYINR